VHLLPVLLLTALIGGLIVGFVTARLLPSLVRSGGIPDVGGVIDRRRTSLADKAAIVVLAAAVAGSFALAPGEEGTVALVEVNGNTVAKLNLLENHFLIVKGVHGLLRVETHDGRARVAEADCPNKICVRTGWRGRAGEVIVCVPNKTIVRILGRDSGEVRGITG
jgi:hypothetical protein